MEKSQNSTKARTDTAYLNCQADSTPSYFKKISGFDYFVLAGGVMNLIVITYLIGYWLLHG